jgi:hypothetical protein
MIKSRGRELCCIAALFAAVAVAVAVPVVASAATVGAIGVQQQHPDPFIGGVRPQHNDPYIG